MSSPNWAEITTAVATILVALTGVAAFSISGMTLHSFAGIGLGDEDVKSLISKVKKNKKAVARIRGAKILNNR